MASCRLAPAGTTSRAGLPGPAPTDCPLKQHSLAAHLSHDTAAAEEGWHLTCLQVYMLHAWPQLPFPRCIRCAVSMPAHPQLRRAQSQSLVKEARTLCAAAPCQGVPMLNNLATPSASPSSLQA